MEGWQIAIVLKPFGLLLFFAGIVAIALLIKKIIPDGPLKDILYDRTFRDKHPWQFMAVWTVLMVSLWTWIIVYLIR